MTFGGYAYGSSALGSSSSPIPCPRPSCNLVVMEILQRLKDMELYIGCSNNSIIELTYNK